MTTHKSLWLMSIVLILFGFALNLLADDTIPIRDLPKAVKSTVTQRYPKAELTGARKTIEDKVEVYEVELVDGGKLIEIAVFTDGKIDWVGIDLAIKDLPKQVLASVHKKYPGAKLDHASTVYTVKEGKDHLEHYSVELTTKTGKKRELEVSPKGEIEDDQEVKI